MGFIWVVKNRLCYKMLNDRFKNRPKCESPANENAGYYILSDTDTILRTKFNSRADAHTQEICKRTKVRDCIIDDAVNGRRAQCVANYIIIIL